MSAKMEMPSYFNIQTDREILARRPGILLMDRENNQCFIIDVSFVVTPTVFR